METTKKNKTLKTLAQLINKNKEQLIHFNKQDIKRCENGDAALLDRLKIDERKVRGMIAAIEQVAKEEDPENKILFAYNHPNKLKIENRTVPFGLILIIYESRPDVTIEAAILAFKSGNKILLKGGSEARLSNLFLVKLWQEALVKNNLDRNWVSYLDLNRKQMQEVIVNNKRKIDLIVPRGGEGLIKYITSHSNIPVLISGRGNNFLYLDDESDFKMAVDIILDGKSRLSVCNALDKVLLNASIAGLRSKLDMLTEALKKKNIKVYGDPQIQRMNKHILKMENKSMMEEEFLSAKILLTTVDDMDEAIETINKYSGGHSATIVTSNKKKAQQFQQQVDCAAVYHNASTRFTDGGQFGFGAEMAISTQKLHFRGPVGLSQLVTNKWFISGNGQTRG